MQRVKQYAAVVFLLLIFPTARFVSNKFMLEADNEIYSYIPQESDFVIELNTKNFIKEIAYQRIYEEAYFMSRVYPETEDEEQETKFEETGIDVFEKVILFREQWANETVWFALMKYSDEQLVRSFLTKQIPEAQFEFSDDYLIAQLSPSSHQENLNEHLIKISKKEVKAFTERVNLAKLFDPRKEVNCYIIPKTTPENQLIEGHFSFDFLEDHIAVNGSFTPVPGFNETPPLAYALDKENALSMRSSLNLFNSIYWFNKEKIENVPQYSQMAFDYDGVACKLINKDQGFSTPFKSYPKVKTHFDILDKEVWYAFFDSLRLNDNLKIDTVANNIITKEGAHFSYKLSDTDFELMQNPFALLPSDEPNIYFDFWMEIDAMIDRTVFSIDEQNPPNTLEQRVGIMVANKMMDEIRLMANMEWITFRLTKPEGNEIIADGRVEMKIKDGHAIVESMSLGAAAATFLKNY